MSEKFRLDRKVGFQNIIFTKCINVIIDNIGPSIILRSIVHSKSDVSFNQTCHGSNINIGNNKFWQNRTGTIFEVNEIILKFIVPPIY